MGINEGVTSLPQSPTMRRGSLLKIIRQDKPIIDEYGTNYGQSKTPYPVLEMLQQVRKNNDQAAICVRLMGADRYADLRPGPEKGLFEPRAIIQRAARTLLFEICSRGVENFNSYYEFSSNIDYREDLAAIESGHFTYNNFERYKTLLDGFCFRNLSVKEELSKRCFNGRLTVMIEDQDIDLTGMWYDWETSVPDTPGYDPRNYDLPYFKTQYSEFR